MAFCLGVYYLLPFVRWNRGLGSRLIGGGPDGQGVSTDTRIPTRWSNDQNLRWKAPHADGVAQPGADEATEVSSAVMASSAASSFEATGAGYRRSVLVAQFAEFLRRSVHARGDSVDALVDEATKLEPELRDPDFTEFLGLVKLAAPQLKALQAAGTDELVAMLDQLCELRRVVRSVLRVEPLVSLGGSGGHDLPVMGVRLPKSRVKNPELHYVPRVSEPRSYCLQSAQHG